MENNRWMIGILSFDDQGVNGFFVFLSLAYETQMSSKRLSV
jgi:hypothetical protein